MEEPLTAERHEIVGLADSVYDRVRRDILSGQLRPNQALVEADIAERLGISRMPVREGLVRLANEGLVKSQRRRWIVHEHTKDEVRYIYEVRAALEAEASMLAAVRATVSERRLILDHGRPECFTKAQSQSARIDANEVFHQHIILAARNPRLVEMLNRNVTYFNFRFSLYSSSEELEESGSQHLSISQAIWNGDPEAARMAAHDHVMHALQIIERAAG